MYPTSLLPNTMIFRADQINCLFTQDLMGNVLARYHLKYHEAYKSHGGLVTALELLTVEQGSLDMDLEHDARSVLRADPCLLSE